MKKILLPYFLVCAALSTKAQTAKLVVTDSVPIMQQQLLLPNRVINKASNGTVYVLPQDGMPCLVPDSSAWALMPNAKPEDVQSGIMPNPYKPNSIWNKRFESEKNVLSESFIKMATPVPYKPQSFPKIITLPPAKATPKKKID
jgi:hypothetical protein